MASGVFRTDVSRKAAASQPLLDRAAQGIGGAGGETSAAGLGSSTAYLDSAAEEVNKLIDTDVKTLLDSFEALMSLSRIRHKDRYQIAQENFELEARADVMVRAAQSLTLLSHSLKLSLLLSQEPVDAPLVPGQEVAHSLDEEALRLIVKTTKHRMRCAELLSQISDIGNETEGEEGEGENRESSDVLKTEAENMQPTAEDQEDVSEQLEGRVSPDNEDDDDDDDDDMEDV